RRRGRHRGGPRVGDGHPGGGAHGDPRLVRVRARARRAADDEPRPRGRPRGRCLVTPGVDAAPTFVDPPRRAPAPAVRADGPPPDESALEQLLRQPERFVAALEDAPLAPILRMLLAVTLVGAAVFGAVLGTYRGGLQVL